MPPAARLADMHTCPMVTGVVPHVGGPILPPCCPTVIICGMPAARVTDLATCAGPPDVIAKGSPTVLIGNLLAARVGDLTVHGGVIVTGAPTVIIGEAGSGSGLSPSMGGAPMANAMAASHQSVASAAPPGASPAPQQAALRDAAREGVPLVKRNPLAGK